MRFRCDRCRNSSRGQRGPPRLLLRRELSRKFHSKCYRRSPSFFRGRSASAHSRAGIRALRVHVPVVLCAFRGIRRIAFHLARVKKSLRVRIGDLQEESKSARGAYARSRKRYLDNASPIRSTRGQTRVSRRDRIVFVFVVATFGGKRTSAEWRSFCCPP